MFKCLGLLLVLLRSWLLVSYLEVLLYADAFSGSLQMKKAYSILNVASLVPFLPLCHIQVLMDIHSSFDDLLSKFDIGHYEPRLHHPDFLQVLQNRHLTFHSPPDKKPIMIPFLEMSAFPSYF